MRFPKDRRAQAGAAVARPAPTGPADRPAQEPPC